MLDITRNQFLLAGLVLLLLGVQFRIVETYKLTPEFTRFLAERTGHPLPAVNAASPSLSQGEGPKVQKEFKPPDWLGWSLISVGAVLVLHSMGMKKAG